MAFAYYRRLNASQKAIYRQSDTISGIRLTNAQILQASVQQLALALKREDKTAVARAGQRLLSDMLRGLKAPPVKLKLLAVRPSNEWEELHGLYQPATRGTPASITVWMHTAQRKQVVAFRTFLRTLLHEICHHLDYELFMLAESYHTEGFYQRESSLFHQLVTQTD